MDLGASIIAVFAVLVIAALTKLIVEGTAGFLFEGVAQIARGVFIAFVWLVRQTLRLIWWFVVGWWWRRWVSPMGW